MTTESATSGTTAARTGELARGWACSTSDPREALRIADRVLAGGASTEEADSAVLLRGCAFALIGEFSRCHELLAGRPDLAVELPATEPARRALLALGIAQFRRGDAEQAFVSWERVRRASAAAADRQVEGNALVQMGIALTEQGRVPKAVDSLLSALAIFEAARIDRGVAVARGNLGNAMLQIGEYGMAAEHYLAGLRILEALGDRRGRAIGLASLGRVQMKAGNLVEGIESIRAAAGAFEELGLRLEEAIALYRLGCALIELGRPREAIGPLQASIALSDATGSFQYAVSARVHGAEALAALGEVDAAADLLRQSLAETESDDRRPLRVEALVTLARLHLNHPGAEALRGLPRREEALLEASATGIESSLLVEAHAELAEHFEKAGDLGRALHHLRRHLHHARVAADERGRQAVARAEVELTMQRLRREHELAVSNNQRLESALAQAREAHARAEKASRDKSTLLGIVAHDLRNPLAHIALASDDLQHEDDPARLRSELRAIHLSAERAARLLRTLLDGAAAEAGQLRLSLEAVDLAAVVSRLCSQLDVFAREKNQSLVVLASSPVPAHVDPARVEQVVQNLVDNAIKFSPRGARTEVAVAARAGRAVITVRDEGAGMTPVDIDRAFAPFAEMSAEPTGSEPSTGLGLSIVRQLVQAMGGTIDVQSDGPGHGCTFRVDLPAGRR